jgi:hypothetical protein
MQVLAEAWRRESALLAEYAGVSGASGADLVRIIWDWASSAERAPFMRLFFEVYIQAMSHPSTYSDRGRAMVTEWLGQFGTAFSSPASQAGDASATLVIAVLRGLLLDRLNTGDEQRTDHALEQFARHLDRPHP